MPRKRLTIKDEDAQFIQQLVQGQNVRLILNGRLRVLGCSEMLLKWGEVGDSVKAFFPSLTMEDISQISHYFAVGNRTGKKRLQTCDSQYACPTFSREIEVNHQPNHQELNNKGQGTDKTISDRVSSPSRASKNSENIKKLQLWRPSCVGLTLPSGASALLLELVEDNSEATAAQVTETAATPIIAEAVDNVDNFVEKSLAPAMVQDFSSNKCARRSVSGLKEGQDGDGQSEQSGTESSAVANAKLVAVLKNMLQASSDPIMVLSAEPSNYQEVLYANSALKTLRGLWPMQELSPESVDSSESRPTEQFSWQPHLLTWPWGERDREEIRLFLNRLEQGDYSRREYYLPDLGQWWSVELRPIECVKDGGYKVLTYWVVVMRNVTQQHREEMLSRVRQRTTALSLQNRPLPEVMKCFLQGLEKMAEGWKASVLHITSEGCELNGDVDPSVAEWVRCIPVEHVQIKWRQRDPYCTGKAFVVGYPDLAKQMLQEGFIPNSKVGSVIEVGLYDCKKQVFGSLMFTHSDSTEGRSHRVLPLCRLLENSAPDISLILERDMQRQELEYLAYKDSLTGLLNRAGFQRETSLELQESAKDGREFVLGLLDLNRFKQVNDSLGHVLGDELLSILAQRLNDLAQRYPISTLARMGGDEFAFLLHDKSLIHEVSRALSEALGAPFSLDGQLVRINIALGWSLFPETGSELTALLKQADSAMYAAKRGGHSAHVYSPSQQPRIPTLDLENALYEAMQNQQFELIYQPQVRCSNREIIGAEALIRWKHPRLGQVSPDLFIPVAESIGLIHELGSWVLSEACKAAQSWENDISVSVNVSAVQLRSECFQRSVWQALNDSGLDPSRLILEMTETALLTDMGEAKNRLRELRHQGVRVSVDDFGTGYSTLLTLRQLLADELKIDRTFTRDLNVQEGGDEGRAIVHSTVALARALGMKVVAEGVETEMQAEALREMGCDYIQGWLVAPGLRCKSFADFVAFQVQRQPMVLESQAELLDERGMLQSHGKSQVYNKHGKLVKKQNISREQRAIAALLSFGIT